ncbi:MAG: hypothetical protein FWC50_09980, partial [Planctomycetaceae bacterium]|nr:hypothetical protein [Planctomycetaceae bacterium]
MIGQGRPNQVLRRVAFATVLVLTTGIWGNVSAVLFVCAQTPFSQHALPVSAPETKQPLQNGNAVILTQIAQTR